VEGLKGGDLDFFFCFFFGKYMEGCNSLAAGLASLYILRLGGC
jgi:hypothetical protein